MKFVKAAGVVTWSGGMIPLRQNQSIADDHPLVAERPDLFTDEDPGADIITPARVQSAMQGPGAVRMERAPSAPPVVKAPPRKTATGE